MARPGVTLVVAADPARGFQFPYLLRMPAAMPPGINYLLVEPNNTGAVADDLGVHFGAAWKTSEHAIGAFVAERLELPLLVPVFPRPAERWQVYTHALDRDTMLLSTGPGHRLDLQLLAMVDDARERLAAAGMATREKMLLTGFSASGTFANRFTMLHPTRVQAVASGGINGILMLPLAEAGGRALEYPLGIADFAAIAGEPFRADDWKAVPQFIYMGADDDNDAVAFDDGYSEFERDVVHAAIGKIMQPDRWAFCQARYAEAGARVTFKTYPGVGHGTDGEINTEIAEFFRQAMAGDSAGGPGVN